MAIQKGWRLKALGGIMRSFQSAHDRDVSLIIIPTAGSDPHNHQKPNHIGCMRLKEGVAASTRYNAPITVIGDYPDAKGVCLSTKYGRWIFEYYRSLSVKVISVGGTGNNTVWDILSVKENIAKCVAPGASIGFVSDYWHTLRCALTLYSLGYDIKWINTHSILDRPLWKELVLFVAGWIDPQWSGTIGKKLGKLAQQDADRYLATTKIVT